MRTLETLTPHAPGTRTALAPTSGKDPAGQSTDACAWMDGEAHLYMYDIALNLQNFIQI